MKYIFYCIYNTQYLDGKNRKNKTPWFDALGLMIAGSFCWLSIIVEILFFYVFDRNFPTISIVGVIIICILLFYLHYFFFIRGRKYEKIYEQYKSASNNGKTTEKLICVLYIFFPALLSMVIAMIWHKII
jgi:Ca2+/Na+ antiporter